MAKSRNAATIDLDIPVDAKHDKRVTFKHEHELREGWDVAIRVGKMPE